MLKNAARSRLLLLGGAVVLCLTMIVGLGAGPAIGPVAAQSGTTVTYHAGWNLVAAPTGTILEKANGPIYAFGPDSNSYQVVGPGELVGGRAVWAYFAADTTVTLGRTAADYSRVLVPADSFVLAGNPSSSERVSISGADTAFAYDPVLGYTSVSELAPGQGAWLLSHSSGIITLGKAPADAASERVLRLQRALRDNPTDRATIDALGVAAGDMVQQRRYANVQAILDDLRAAEEDGLREKGAGPLPPFSSIQRDGAVGVRESVANARDAAQAGRLDLADAEIERARQAAATAEDDGVSLAKPGGMSVYAVATPRQAAPGLTSFGALLRAAFFSVGLGQAPDDRFWNLATSVLTNTPPQGPVPVLATPTPIPTPAAPCTAGCRFSGDGKAAGQTAGAEGISIGATFTFQMTVANDRVSGDGQYTETISVAGAGAGQCAVITYTGALAVSGSLTGATLHLSFRGTGTTNVSCGASNSTIPFNELAFATGFFNPLDIEAKDGAMGTATLSPRYVGQGSGTLTVTLHSR